MKEDFLHYLWRFKRFDSSSLKTIDGEAIEIINVGEYNSNAGPDFLNAKLRIGDVLWAGNVEMHLSAVEWLKHGHHNDAAYDNVILHVVMEADATIHLRSGTILPCLCLKPYINEQLLGSYQKLLHNVYWIPCQHHFYEVNDLTKQTWWERLLIERLEEKTMPIKQQLIENQYFWEEIFYRQLAKNFGLKVNDLPFEMLARSLSLSVIGKHKNSLFQIEALVFGQAGFLEDKTFADEYPQQLQREYLFLKQKFQLQPIEVHLWKFLRLRPANFPTIRLAQFARLLHSAVHLFSKIMDTEDLNTLVAYFDIALEGYWEDHYVFDKPSKKIKKHLGKNTIDLLLINTVVPFIFLYGKHKNEDKVQDRALAFLEQIPAEQNSIVQNWIKLGVEANSAARTQALLQQKRKYCDEKKCLQCAIGTAILRTC
jgi:hypothetical protein